MDTYDTAANATASPGAIEEVMHAWESALAAHDLEALLACYAPDATLESPVAAHITGVGVRRGHAQPPHLAGEPIPNDSTLLHGIEYLPVNSDRPESTPASAVSSFLKPWPHQSSVARAKSNQLWVNVRNDDRSP